MLSGLAGSCCIGSGLEEDPALAMAVEFCVEGWMLDGMLHLSISYRHSSGRVEYQGT